MGDVLWFPANSVQGAEIPAYVHFCSHKFSSNISVRNQPINNFWYGSDFGEAYLPLPVEIGTSISMQYSSNPSSILENRSLNTELGSTPQSRTQGTLYNNAGDVFGGGLRGVGFEGPNSEAASKGNEIPLNFNDQAHAYENFLDIVDTTWLGQVRRRYIFSFVLMSKSAGDAAASINLSTFFSNRLLSRLAPQSRFSSGNNSRSAHPPMWSINVVNAGFGEAGQSTLNWIGAWPQLCVLEDVKAFRTGGDGTNILALQEIQGYPLPLQTNIQLSFIELEPVYVPYYSVSSLAPALARSQFFTSS